MQDMSRDDFGEDSHPYLQMATVPHMAEKE
jgi:hypothetical protein